MLTKNKITDQKTLFSVMVILFFIWGFITLLNDLLIPILKAKLYLTYAEAMLVQFCFFCTYFIMAMPAAALVNKMHYKKSIIIALLIIAGGALLFIPADLTLTYAIFLLALFILATGIVVLQVSANPLVTLLGNPDTASARLTLAQGVNSLGYVLAPILISGVIVAHGLVLPYLLIAIAMVFVAVFIGFFNFRQVDNPHQTTQTIETDTHPLSLWRHGPFIWGVIGIFVYVGAEVTGGSLIVNFLHLPNIANFSIATAAKYLSVYWGGAMIGRLLGAYILVRIRPSKALIFNALANILLLFGVILTSGHLAMWCLLFLGLFNSIMFPTIFALTVGDLPNQQLKNKASGYLIMAIVGGAIVPELQGLLADAIGLQTSFVLLLACYATIASYGFYIKAQRNHLHAP